MSNLSSHFQNLSGSPKPFAVDSLFSSSNNAYSYTSDTSQLLQQLIGEVNDQASVLNELVGAVSGKSGGSALQNILGGASFGGSALGGIASAAKGGFSWQSIVSDIFPVGGLISGIASLFDSAPTPPPLDQYAAPPSLNFNAVLNSNGTLSQGATNQYGFTESTGSGLDLLDAQGGPYSPYQRASNGSLVPAAGDPTSLYSGTLNLPGALQSLVQNSPASPNPGTSSYSSVTNPAQPAPAPAAPAAAGLSSTNASLTADPSNPVPNFDQQWFNDHGSMIASAVRAELLNYHPIVDTINDL